MLFMAKQKKTEQPKSDRHKMPGRVLRMRQSMWDRVEELAELLGSDATHEIRTAVRERLQKHNLWPKTADKSELADEN